MADRMNAGGSVKMVRFCLQGHEIVYQKGEILRSTCPFCKSPMDRTRKPVPYEEWQRTKAELEAQAKAAAREQEQEEQVPEAQVPELQTPAEASQMDGRDPWAGNPAEEQPQNTGTRLGLGLFGNAQESGNSSSGVGMFGQDTGGMEQGFGAGGFGRDPSWNSFGQTPGMPGFRPGLNPNGFNPNGFNPNQGSIPNSYNRNFSRFGTGQSKDIPGASGMGTQSRQTADGLYLSLYGDRIAIPPEGAWIGREGLGREWFDGNLMISRRHVYVKPNFQTGRLQVNEDKSLNGVFFTGLDGRKEQLTGARMMEAGEILWIYNIPLKIEK